MHRSGLLPDGIAVDNLLHRIWIQKLCLEKTLRACAKLCNPYWWRRFRLFSIGRDYCPDRRAWICLDRRRSFANDGYQLKLWYRESRMRAPNNYPGNGKDGGRFELLSLRGAMIKELRETCRLTCRGYIIYIRSLFLRLRAVNPRFKVQSRRSIIYTSLLWLTSDQKRFLLGKSTIFGPSEPGF